MAAIFSCPACRQTISADVAAGTLVQCPLCRQVVTVPGAPGALGLGESPPVSPFGGPAAPGGPPAPMPGGYAVPGQTLRPPVPATQGLAIGALVCGILGLLACPLVGIVGVVLGIVALVRVKSDPQRHGGKGMAIGGIATGAVSIVLVPLVIALLWPFFMQGFELAMREECEANMRGIGQALYIYAQGDGMFPEKGADWSGRLLSAGNIAPFAIMCPAAGPQGGPPYYYVPGYGLNSNPTQIILYDHPDAHGGQGGNILYQDGHVAWVPSPQYEQAIAAITLPDGTPWAPHKMTAEDYDEEGEEDEADR